MHTLLMTVLIILASSTHKHPHAHKFTVTSATSYIGEEACLKAAEEMEAYITRKTPKKAILKIDSDCIRARVLEG